MVQIVAAALPRRRRSNGNGHGHGKPTRQSEKLDFFFSSESSSTFPSSSTLRGPPSMSHLSSSISSTPPSFENSNNNHLHHNRKRNLHLLSSQQYTPLPPVSADKTSATFFLHFINTQNTFKDATTITFKEAETDVEDEIFDLITEEEEDSCYSSGSSNCSLLISHPPTLAYPISNAKIDHISRESNRSNSLIQERISSAKAIAVAISSSAVALSPTVPFSVRSTPACASSSFTTNDSVYKLKTLLSDDGMGSSSSHHQILAISLPSSIHSKQLEDNHHEQQKHLLERKTACFLISKAISKSQLIREEAFLRTSRL